MEFVFTGAVMYRLSLLTGNWTHRKREHRVVRQVSNGEGHQGLLLKLHPIFELTPEVRPCLLLGASVLDVGPVLLGLLYHIGRDAYQSRLRFRAPPGREFLRRTRWRRFPEPYLLTRRKEQIHRGFIEMVAKIGKGDIHRVDFPANASDQEVLHLLLTSPIPRLIEE